MQNQFKVSCRCATYNHAAYIKDAFHGFCKQETCFPFVCVIVDDASTDGEQDVINKYLEDNFDLHNPQVARHYENEDYRFIFSQHLINRNCYFAVYLLKYNHYQSGKTRYPYLKEWVEKSEYSASCEGDDYWIANTKLQKQVDYLDSHKGCSGVFANIVLRNEKEEKIIESKIVFDKEKYTINDVYRGVVFPINSLCLRTEVWLQSSRLDLKAHGDFKQAYACGQNGYIHHINDFFSVYRKTGMGMSSQWNARDQFIHDIKEWYDLFKQLDFPDKAGHSMFQTKLINDYIYNCGVKDFPFSEIKNNLFVSKWYIYIVGSLFYPFKRAYKSLVIRINRLNGER